MATQGAASVRNATHDSLSCWSLSMTKPSPLGRELSLLTAISGYPIGFLHWYVRIEYLNIFFVLTHYAFGGVSPQCVLFALSTPLRLRGRIGVFRRRERSASQPFSLGSPTSASRSLSSVRGFYSSRGCRRLIRLGSVRPSSSSTCSSLSSLTRGEKVNPGVRMCFPGATAYIFESGFL